jgi:predicted metal-dependent peptidase
VRDAPDQSETGIKEEEAKWDVIVTQAAKLSERMGDMPAGMKRIIDEILDAKVHWEEALSRWIVEQSDTDYSWKSPNRRYLSQDLYLPSLQGDELMPIAFMVDTSGSQDARAINQCGAEIQAALSTYVTEFSVPVIYCDAAVQGVDEIDAYDTVELNPVGGGGTDFRPPFKYIEDEQIEVEGAIYLTDGHCSRFPEEPDYPVLWVITPKGKRNFEPPFGEVISMND